MTNERRWVEGFEDDPDAIVTDGKIRFYDGDAHPSAGSRGVGWLVPYSRQIGAMYHDKIKREELEQLECLCEAPGCGPGELLSRG